jgi:hypothetical protein
MTESEWHTSDDAGAMLDYLWARHGVSPHAIDVRFGDDMGDIPAAPGALVDLERALHRYYLACCRVIWKLLPQEESRRGVELAEQFVDGKVSDEEIRKYNWHVEGAELCIDFNTEPEAIDCWVAEIRALTEAELRSMLHPPEAAQLIEPRELLKRAAYFADYAMIYPSLSPKGPPTASYRPFLSPEVLRQSVAYPAATADKPRC